MNQRVLAHLLSDVGSVLRGGDNVDHTVGNTSLSTDIGHCEDRVRSFGGCFELRRTRLTVTFMDGGKVEMRELTTTVFPAARAAATLRVTIALGN